MFPFPVCIPVEGAAVTSVLPPPEVLLGEYGGGGSSGASGWKLPDENVSMYPSG